MPPMEHSATPQLNDRFILSSRIAGQVIAAVGLLVLFGWAIGSDAIARLHSSLPTMKPNSALCLVLCGVSLWGINTRKPTVPGDWAIRAAAVIVLLLGGATLAEYASDSSLGIDQWLFNVGTSGLHPGRMAQMTASLFVVSALALLTIDVETSGGLRPAQGLALVLLLVALVEVLGYLFAVPSPYTIRPDSSVPLHTALLLVLLALALLAARPNAGLMQRITNDTAAGQVGRRLIPLVVVIPIAVAWFRIWGQHQGWYDTEFGTALHATASVLLLVMLTWWTVGALWRRELTRERMERALHHVQARHSAILASAVDAMIAMDSAGTVIEFNPAAERIFHIARQDAIGRNVADTVVPERLREAFARTVERFLGSGEPQVLGRSIQQPGRRGDNTEFPAEFVLAQVEGVEPPVFTAFVRDISQRLRSESERERLNASLRQRVAEVEAANRELDSFAYVASHDLRSPLRDILSLSTWVAEDGEGKIAPASLKHLEKLQARAARMERLLDDLLEYSRIGRVAPKTEDVRVSDLIDDALDLVGPHEGFTINTAGGEAVIHSPRAPLVHALRNLVNNAIKHHHKRSGIISIEVAPVGAGLLRFTVGDDGPGIAMEYHDVVFQPFRTLRRRDEVEGSGLGLAIVKKMVESVGGHVDIQSEPGAGTRISFTWPERWEAKVRDVQEWEAQERIAS